jgi:hypothetical protein
MIKMAKITFIATTQNETKLRELNRKKGDISNIINKALEMYLQKEEN